MARETFGVFLKKQRLERGLGLRHFAKRCGLQASNYSRLESGALRPPTGGVVDRMAEALGWSKGSPHCRRLHDLAADGRDQIPTDVEQLIRKNRWLPVFLRTLEDERIPANEWETLLGELQEKCKMRVRQTLQSLLPDLTKELRELYGGRLKGIWIYGSYARKVEKEGSDLDVAMILDDFDRPWEEIQRTGRIVSHFSLTSGVTLSLIPVRWREWNQREKPLIQNIRREGLLTL